MHRQRGAQAGVQDERLAYLAKPFTPGTLASKVRQILDEQAGGRYIRGMRWTFRPKPLDYLVFLLCAALVAALSAAAYSGRGGGHAVRITGPGGTWIYPLEENRTVGVEGPLGLTTIRIEGGAVRVIDSPCPQKRCIRRGGISGSGHWNACLPNQVFLEIEAQGEERPDAHTH